MLEPETPLPRLTITVNTCCFALCFALWVLFGPSTKAIAVDFHLSLGEASFLKAVPILIGSAFRIPIGILTDRFGARVVFPSVMLAGSLAALGVSFASTGPQLFLGALGLGIIGTSFAVGVQSISLATERTRQGFALGIFGVGNVGTAITTFMLPIMLAAWGWRVSFRYAAALVALGAAGYFWMMTGGAVKRSGATFQALLAPLGSGKTWLFGLYYMATFGAFVASVLILGDIYSDAYEMPAKTAGLLATAFSVAASVSRIPGGSFSDRFGAINVLRAAFASTVVFLAPVAARPPLAVAFVCLLLAGISMGIGSAATFKLIPEHFPGSVGAVGGAVGAIGGLAGFFLPQIAGWVKSAAGVSLQVLPLMAVALVAFGALQWTSRSRPQETMPESGGADLAALATGVAREDRKTVQEQI